MESQVARKAFGAPSSRVNSQSRDKVTKSRHAAEQTEEPVRSPCPIIIIIDKLSNLS